MARFYLGYTMERAQLVFQPVYAPTNLHQEIPLAVLEDCAAKLVDLPLGNQFSLDDDAHAMTHLLHLMKEVGRQENGEAVLTA